MPKISLFINKSVEQNAAIYFEAAKKAKKKTEGAKKTIALYKKKLEQAQKDKTQFQEQQQKKKQSEDEQKEALAGRKAKEKWYHKLRWFYSSIGFLVIGGRDAATNELVVKKHTSPKDIVLHTGIAGSPFVIIKHAEKIDSSKEHEIDKQTTEEAAVFCASFSKAWKLGIGIVDVFYVNPEQVSKEARSGEFIARGSFMVYGKKNYLRVEPKIALCLIKEKDESIAIMSGPLTAVQKHALNGKYLQIEQGDERSSDLAKQIQAKLETQKYGITLDEIIRVLPAGGGKIAR